MNAREEEKKPSFIFRLDQPQKKQVSVCRHFLLLWIFLCNRQLAVVLSNAEVLHFTRYIVVQAFLCSINLRTFA